MTPELVRFAVLGPLALRIDGDLVTRMVPQRRAVVAVLIVNAGRTVSVERLIDHVWRTWAPRTAAKNIQVHVWALRRLVGDRIRTDPSGYRLELTDRDSSDLREFSDLVRAARAERDCARVAAAADRYRQALDLWRGPALGDLVARGLLGDRARPLDDHRIEVIREWANCEIELGHHSALIEPLTALVDQFPLDEHLRELLMRVLHRTGQPTNALAVYAEAASVLSNELGVPPSQRLRTVAAAIRQDALGMRGAQP